VPQLWLQSSSVHTSANNMRRSLLDRSGHILDPSMLTLSDLCMLPNNDCIVQSVRHWAMATAKLEVRRRWVENARESNKDFAYGIPEESAISV
jgi:hypothetical protein